MTTRERKQREMAEREKLFLSKAAQLIRDHGLLNVQMARIADECDYATGTLYQHFASKEDLLVALMTESAQLRGNLFERAARWQAPSRDRMLAIAVADMIFVEKNPDHFRIEQFARTEVIWGAASKARRDAHMQAERPLCDNVLTIIRDAAHCGDLDLRGLSPEEVSVGLWSLALGMHSLVHAEGVLEVYDIREPYALMGRHMHHMLNGLDWRPLQNLEDEPGMGKTVLTLKRKVFADFCDLA